MNNIHPFLWLDRSAEEVAGFYASLFGAKATIVEASERLARLQLDGTEYVLFNGGPHYKLTPAFSISIDCATQIEIDELWEKLGAGGEYLSCGWVIDRFGVCWQVVPAVLREYLEDPDEKVSERVMNVMLGMEKLDIAELERAHHGAASPASP